MRPPDDCRSVRFWRPATPGVAGMFRLEHEHRLKTTYTEQYFVVGVYAGAFDGWYRGQVRSHVAGSIKLKEPGEVHRDLRVHAPFTLQGVGFAPKFVASAAEALGLHGTAVFKASSYGPDARASRLAFAMHDALARDDSSELECSARVAEALAELLAAPAESRRRAPRAVLRARAFLHDAGAQKISLDELAEYAGLDKFHLVRAFRTEVGLPPYEYLTYLRVARARELLERGLRVAEVAQAVGFYDESQLHRHFRRIVGLPPGVYARGFTSRPSTPRSPKAGRRGRPMLSA